MNRGSLLCRMKEGIRRNQQVPAGLIGGNCVFTSVRLPPHVREMGRSLYEPVMVSIGPHHLSSESTSAMQLQKWRLLDEFLRRGGEACILEACIEAVRSTEPRARQFYGNTLELGSDDFVEMMVLDGCFILEYLLKWSERNDGFVQRTSISVYSDILLVENQIPLFILRQLFSLRIAAADRVYQGLLDLIFSFFIRLDPPGLVRHPAVPNREGVVYHLLHLQYQRIVITMLGASPSGIPAGIVTSSVRARMAAGTTPTPFAIPCVTKLRECGVAFKEKKSPASLFDVTFSSGTMEIPRLAMNGGTRTLLANLFALEQTDQDCHERTVTGYLLLMNALVQTSADVAVLQRSDVLPNMLSSEEDAATFFNQLGGVALFDTRVHQFAQLFRDTNEYCNSRWNGYFAMFKRDHLRSPCSIINLVVAFVLLCGSLMSVGYIICRYHHACS